jgi:hypothetical protein
MKTKKVPIKEKGDLAAETRERVRKDIRNTLSQKDNKARALFSVRRSPVRYNMTNLEAYHFFISNLHTHSSPNKLSQSKMVNLTTSDDVEFKVDREVVERSVLIKNMLEGSSLLIVATGRCLMLYAYLPHFHFRCR